MILPVLACLVAPVELDRTTDPRPDVLIVLIDDLSDRDVDESLDMPVLTGLAERGLRFRRAYAHPVCSPSRYALLHGRYSFRGGFGDVLRADDGPPVLGAPTLPQSLQAAGYATACIGKWHLSRHKDPRRVAEDVLTAGFDRWLAGVPYGVESYIRWTSIAASRDQAGELSYRETLETQYITDLQTQALIDWWKRTPSPRFAYLPYQALHGPFESLPRSILAVDEPDTKGMSRKQKNAALLDARWKAMATRLDEGLGRILDVVDLDRTLVFVLADNGTAPNAGVYPANRSKPKVYEGGIRVPFLVAGPQVQRRGSTDALASVVDVAATIWDVCQVQPPAGTGEDGLSLRGTLESGATQRTYVYTQRFRVQKAKTEAEAVVSSDGMKLVRWEGRTEAAFDIDADPLEHRPLPLEDPRLTELRLLLERLGD